MADSSPECSFCRLDEPAVTMYRDATVQAFISLAPINRYHVIVAPRAHYEHLSELPATTVTTAVSLAQRLSAAIIAVARPDALTLLSDEDLTGRMLNQIAARIFGQKCSSITISSAKNSWPTITSGQTWKPLSV